MFNEAGERSEATGGRAPAHASTRLSTAYGTQVVMTRTRRGAGAHMLRHRLLPANRPRVLTADEYEHTRALPIRFGGSASRVDGRQPSCSENHGNLALETVAQLPPLYN